MEEKRKSNIGIIICIIIIILLIVAIFGMWYYYNHLNKQKELVNDTTSTNTPTESNKPVEKKVNKIYEDKDIVYSSFKDNVTAKDEEEYTVDIPYINIDSIDVKKINDEIDKMYTPTIVGQKYYQMVDVSYNKYLNDNILSIVIISTNHYVPDEGYEVYNIDILTGKEITNLEILKKKNIAETEFKKRVQPFFEQAYVHFFGDIEKKENKLYEKEYKQCLQSTLSKINYNVPMFLDANGKLNICGNFDFIAGAGNGIRIVKTDI